MKLAIVLAVVLLAVFIQSANAYTDPSPVVHISADKQVAQTNAHLHVEASDSGFYYGVDSITLQEDGKTIAYKDCNDAEACVLDKDVQHLEKGTHHYSASVKDRGGNRKIESVYIRFIGATPPPVLRFSDTPYAQEGQRVQFRVYAYDFNNTKLAITASSLPKGSTFVDGVFTWRPDYDQAGTYSMIFSTVDSKGQRAARTIAIKVENTNRPPLVFASPNPGNFEINENSNLLFSVNVTDPDNDHPKIEWLVDGKGTSTSSSFNYKTNFGTAGKHVIVARVVDGAFLTRFMWNVTVNDVNRKPAFNKIKNIDIELGKNVKFTVKASDEDKDYLIYQAVMLPQGATFDPDTGVFNWKPSKAGSYEALFSVNDNKGYFASQGVQINVFEKKKTDLEIYTELYEEFLAEQAARKAQIQNQQATEFLNRTFSTMPVCDNGYLCYSYTVYRW